MTAQPIRMRMNILWFLAVLLLAGCTQPPTPTFPSGPSPTVEIEREVATLTIQNEPTPTPEPGPETNDIQINITYPTTGATLKGKIDIEGSVVHPNLKAYGIVYTTDRYHTQNSAWRLNDPIAWNVETSITDGILGTWNTTGAPCVGQACPGSSQPPGQGWKPNPPEGGAHERRRRLRRA